MDISIYSKLRALFACLLGEVKKTERYLGYRWNYIGRECGPFIKMDCNMAANCSYLLQPPPSQIMCEPRS